MLHTTVAKVKYAKRVDEADAEIGQRVRALRLRAHLSQTELGAILGVTFQQVQKYEKGANRISGSRIRRIAEALNSTVTYLMLGHESNETPPDNSAGQVVLSFLSTREGVEVAENFNRLSHEDRRTVRDLVLRLSTTKSN